MGAAPDFYPLASLALRTGCLDLETLSRQPEAWINMLLTVGHAELAAARLARRGPGETAARRPRRR